MLASLARNWWIFLLRGLCAVVFGVMAFAWPGMTLAILVVVYGIYAIADGITALGVGIVGGLDGARWWQMILVGILSIAAGIVAFVWPAITAIALLAIIATWAIIRGVVQIFAAIRLRAVIENEWLLILSGACSLIFGALMIARPQSGALAVIWVIGMYAVIIGVVEIALSLRLRSFRTAIQRTTAALSPSHN